MLASILERHQLAGLRQRLGTRAVALKRKLAGETGVSPAMGDEVHDTKEQASAEAMDEVRRADLERDRAELADVQMALARIDAGTYGVCCDCGEAIGRRRLKAYPTAKRCHDCQEAHERRRGRSAAG